LPSPRPACSCGQPRAGAGHGTCLAMLGARVMELWRGRGLWLDLSVYARMWPAIASWFRVAGTHPLDAGDGATGLLRVPGAYPAG
jgi:hypothetical protein